MSSSLVFAVTVMVFPREAVFTSCACLDAHFLVLRPVCTLAFPAAVTRAFAVTAHLEVNALLIAICARLPKVAKTCFCRVAHLLPVVVDKMGVARTFAFSISVSVSRFGTVKLQTNRGYAQVTLDKVPSPDHITFQASPPPKSHFRQRRPAARVPMLHLQCNIGVKG